MRRWLMYGFCLIICCGACTLESDAPQVDDSSTIPTWEVRGATLTACSPRTDWQPYEVARNDNLTGIANRFNTTVAELTQANCLANPNRLVRGQVLYVPPQLTPAP
ncbi:MAG: LysM peptidoglycan-binding domain-containing protein [Anaerolineae bacterium]|nr:LysM peptidoglycan-binding domain-containing protein [Anaerolineae bacterium]